MLVRIRSEPAMSSNERKVRERVCKEGNQISKQKQQLRQSQVDCIHFELISYFCTLCQQETINQSFLSLNLLIDHRLLCFVY